MNQRVKIEIDGAGGSRSIEGEVIQWCQAVATYGEQHLQVPAVMVRQGDKVLTVPLQAPHAWTKVTISDGAAA